MRCGRLRSRRDSVSGARRQSALTGSGSRRLHIGQISSRLGACVAFPQSQYHVRCSGNVSMTTLLSTHLCLCALITPSVRPLRAPHGPHE